MNFQFLFRILIIFYNWHRLHNLEVLEDKYWKGNRRHSDRYVLVKATMQNITGQTNTNREAILSMIKDLYTKRSDSHRRRIIWSSDNSRSRSLLSEFWPNMFLENGATVMALMKMVVLAGQFCYKQIWLLINIKSLCEKQMLPFLCSGTTQLLSSSTKKKQIWSRK